MSVWFVTPAHQRLALSAVCFEQRRRVIEVLAIHGVDARCVVIANDENLALAEEAGFDVVRRDNRWLGMKFNDGIEHALDRGAEWIVPIGSDDWVDPEYFLPLPVKSARTAHYYAPVESDRLLQVRTSAVIGSGPRVLPRSAFMSSRPCEEKIRRGVDRSLVQALGDISWEYRDLHPLQYVGFRGDRHITLYSKILAERGGEESLEPWKLLATAYPQDLVEEARIAMAGVRRPRSVGRIDAWGVRDRLLHWWGRVSSWRD
jgi:hypothetical protein